MSGILQSIDDFDRALLIVLNQMGSTPFDGFWLMFTKQIYHVPLMLVLLYLLYRSLGRRQFFKAVIVVAVAGFCSDQLTSLAKLYFHRPRPCQEADLLPSLRYIAEHCSPYGFWSGHSCNSMMIAVFVGLSLRSFRSYLLPILVVWAGMMGYSRVYIGVHYPIDLFVGYSMGAIIGYIAHMMYTRLSPDSVIT